MAKLGDFLSNKAGRSVAAPVKPVKFKICFRDQGQGELRLNEASAVMVFLDEDARAEAVASAEREMQQEFPEGNAPHDLLRDRRMSHFLSKALRDEQDPRQLFASNERELRSCLHIEEMRRMVSTYADFIQSEFPDQIDEEQLKQLIEDAEKKSLRDLLTCFGSLLILQALPILAGRYGAGLTGKSGAGKPAASQP
jgi:hypothetical protein